MTDYLKEVTNVRVSASSDYSNPYIETSQWPNETLTPTYAELRKLRAQVAGTTVETGPFATITKFRVYNAGPTNFVTVTWTSTGASSHSQKVPVGTNLSIPDVTPTTDPVITADTADCDCWVLIAGTST